MLIWQELFVEDVSDVLKHFILVAQSALDKGIEKKAVEGNRGR